MALTDLGISESVDHSHPRSEDALNEKRELNICRREAEWKRRQDELLRQKKVAWEIEKLERENRIAAAQESKRRDDLERRVCQRHLELDNLCKEKIRAVAINKREDAWETQENCRLEAMSRKAKREDAAWHARQTEEKALKYEELQAAAHERAQQKQREDALQQKREENIRAREQLRQLKAAEEARRLKSDAKSRSLAVVRAFTEREASRHAAS